MKWFWRKRSRDIRFTAYNTSTPMKVQGTWHFNVGTPTWTTTTSISISTTGTYDHSAEPPVEKETTPILAQRFAGLKLNHKTGKLAFLPVNPSFGAFGVDADAQCQGLRKLAWFGMNELEAFHRSPDWNCGCGFYAVPADMLPKHTLDYESSILILQVELSGRVIIHDAGYRAEHQRVLEVTVPVCDCGNTSSNLIFGSNGHLMAARCNDHKKSILTEDWLEEVMPELLNLDSSVIGSALSALRIQNEIGKGLPIDKASERMGIPFKVAIK